MTMMVEQGPASRRWEARMTGQRLPRPPRPLTRTLPPEAYESAVMRALLDLAPDYPDDARPPTTSLILRRAGSRIPKSARVGSYVHLSAALDRLRSTDRQ